MAVDPSALLSAPNAASAAALMLPSNAGSLGGLGGLNTDQAHAYLSNVYKGLLGRDPEQSAIAGFDARANQSPTDIIQSIIESPEYRTNQIKSMYQNYLGRDADQSGLDNYYNSDMGLNDIQNALQNSQEAQSYLANREPPGPPNIVGTQGPLADPKQLWQVTPWSTGGNSIDQLSNFLTQSLASMGAKNPQAAAQSLLGSAAHESPGFNPTQKEVGGTGYGIWQLTGDQYNGNPNPANNVLNYLQFAKQNGYDPGSMEAQARYGVYALANNPVYSGANDPSGSKQHALQMLLSANDIKSAMPGALEFERPNGYSLNNPTKTPSYDERLANAFGLQTYQNGGGITEQQLNTFLRGGNNGISNNALPPGVMPNGISLLEPGQPYVTPYMTDPRLDGATSATDQSLAANNALVNGWATDAGNNLLNFNANNVFNTGGMISTPVYGSSGTYGQPNQLEGVANPYGPSVGGVNGGGNGTTYSDNMFLDVPTGGTLYSDSP